MNHSLYTSIKVIGITAIFIVSTSSLIFAQSSNCNLKPFGEAENFNVFAINNITQFNSDTEGRVAAGGDIVLSDYSVGIKLTNSNSTRDDLISDKSINFTNGKVENGNAVYKNNQNFNNVDIPNGALRQDSVLNFSNIKAQLEDGSNDLKSLGYNGNISNINGSIELSGNDTIQNIFNLTSTDIDQAYSISINVPSNSTAIINISGQTIKFINKAVNLSNIKSNHVIWNLYNATNVQINGVSIQGSIIAPLANVKFNNGVIYGNLAALSLNSDNTSNSGQFNYDPFKGCINPTQTPIGGDITQTPTIAPITTTPTIVVNTIAPGQVLAVEDTTPSDPSVLADTGDNNVIVNIILSAFIFLVLIIFYRSRNLRIFVKIRP